MTKTALIVVLLLAGMVSAAANTAGYKNVDTVPNGSLDFSPIVVATTQTSITADSPFSASRNAAYQLAIWDSDAEKYIGRSISRPVTSSINLNIGGVVKDMGRKKVREHTYIIYLDSGVYNYPYWYKRITLYGKP